MKKVYDIAVIGGGSAGTMAYLRSVLNYDDTIWFLGDGDTKRRARATWVFEVDNIPGMHGIKRPIDVSAKSTRKWVASQEGLNEKSTIVRNRVDGLAQQGDETFVLTVSSKGGASTYHARHVILATGVMDRQPLINGSIEPLFPFANSGDFLYCVRCDGHRTLGKDLAVIGPEETAVAIGALMHERYGHPGIQIVTHGDQRRAKDGTLALVERFGMTVHCSPIVTILGDSQQGLEGLLLKDGTTVVAQKVIVAMGSIVYNGLAKALGAELAADGRIVVGDANESSVSGLFVVGDLVAGKKMQIYTGWDESVDAADRINARLRKRRSEEVKQHSV